MTNEKRSRIVIGKETPQKYTESGEVIRFIWKTDSAVRSGMPNVIIWRHVPMPGQSFCPRIISLRQKMHTGNGEFICQIHTL